MRNRYRFLDVETDFYNERFVDFYRDYVRKKNILSGSAIAFSSPDHIMTLADILNKAAPEKSLIIRMDDGDFLMLSDIRMGSSIRFFVETVQKAARQTDINIMIHHKIRIRQEEESTADFALRVFQERKTNMDPISSDASS